MALQAKVGAFNTGTGAVGTTVSVSDVGFQPKALIFWWSRASGTVDAVSGSSVGPGMGFTSGSANRIAVACVSEDAQGSSDTNKFFYNSAAIAIHLSTTNLDGLLDLQSFDSGGFTLVVDDQFGTSYRVHYLALGGTDITNAFVGSEAVPGSTGNTSTSGVGFQGDVAFFVSTRNTSLDTNGTNAEVAFGAAVSSTQRGTLMVAGPTAQNTMNAARYCIDAECISNGGTGAPVSVNGRADFVSWGSDGFTLNWLELGSGLMGYLVIQGGQWLIGNLLTQTDTTTDISESGFGFQPAGAMFFSHCTAESTQNVTNAHWSTSIGAFSSTSERGAQATFFEDATADSETTTAVEHDAVYARISTADAIDGLMDIKSVDSGGFTCIMDDADPDQAFVWYVAFGSEAAEEAAARVPPRKVERLPHYRM